MAETVRIDGLKELIRAMSKIDKAAAGELRKELKDRVGDKFSEDARSRVASVGKVKSGRLQRSIKPSVRGADLVIRSSPPLNPGPKSRMGYAAVYEYGYGKRFAYLDPTASQWEATGKLEHELDGYLDWIEKEFRS